MKKDYIIAGVQDFFYSPIINLGLKNKDIYSVNTSFGATFNSRIFLMLPNFLHPLLRKLVIMLRKISISKFW
jgi:hypothetical protein